MRIVGGKFRHREIQFPDEITTRPTKDRIRESVFSAIGEDIENKVCLDLFAGSGSYGIEAISRGASFCYFLDNNKGAIKCIKNNLDKLGIKNAEIVNDDYLEFLKTLYDTSKIDAVFVDPPYKMKIENELLNILLNEKVISNCGIIIMETDEKLNFDESGFKKVKYYKYGFIYVAIIWR